MAAGRRGVNGVIAPHYVDISDERAPAQAPPLSTAAPVVMATINRERLVATLVPVRLRTFVYWRRNSSGTLSLFLFDPETGPQALPTLFLFLGFLLLSDC